MRRWYGICSLVVGTTLVVCRPAIAQLPTTGAATGTQKGSLLTPRAPEGQRAGQVPQGRGPQGQVNQGTGDQSSADVHTEARSREMFTACDGDSDDRLDLFEACEALETLGNPKDSAAFQRLDRDRDGYLTWPEFDQQFRSIVQRGGTFRVKTCRRLVPQAPEQQQAGPMTPLQRLIQSYDKNGNGGLDPSEVDDLVRLMQLPPAIGTGLKALDLDLSGRVEETELAPFFDRLRGNTMIPGLSLPKAGATLPADWAPIDVNGDGVVDRPELARVLRHLDPTLARWANLLLNQLDRNKNGTLEADELPGSMPNSANATPAKPKAKA
jgi:Ca2+-binding EF-hand superfamily protein